MHHQVPLLINITVALLAAFAGGFIARRVGLPTLVGYLLAGLAIGPFTPGFVGDTHTISQLAEMGVIFLMFGVGLHFSLRDLWRVRQVAIPGAVVQMLLTTGLGLALTQVWGWSLKASLVLGLAISIASTVVLLRALMDQGLLNTSHGRVAVGWLVLEDLATIVMLVLLPALVEGHSEIPAWQSVGMALLQTALFVGVMLLIGVRVLPWLLLQIVHTRSRELFILAVVAIALSVAMGAASFFGVSIALGAFLAGVVVSESAVGHQVGDELLPFREIFAVLFFVSVGMLVNPTILWNQIGQVLALTALIVIGKPLVSLLLGLVLPISSRTAAVVAAGLSQIGEFSFIVGQAGVSLGLLTQDQYSLILAAALLSIILNPLLFRAMPVVEKLLDRLPRFQTRIDIAQEPTQEPALPAGGHVVVVGYGHAGEHMVNVLQRLSTPFIVVEVDPIRAAEATNHGLPTLIGDAANSEVLTHANLATAQAIAVMIPDETATALVVAATHDLAPDLKIIARSSTESGVKQLIELGAQYVINPALEASLEVVSHTLISLGYPALQVQSYSDAVRRDQYNSAISTALEHETLEQLLNTTRGLTIAWYTIEPQSHLAGKSLKEAGIREQSGASVIALIHKQQLIANPKSNVVFQVGDLVGLIGDKEQVSQAAHQVAPSAMALITTTPTPNRQPAALAEAVS